MLILLIFINDDSYMVWLYLFSFLIENKLMHDIERVNELKNFALKFNLIEPTNKVCIWHLFWKDFGNQFFSFKHFLTVK